MAQEATWAAVPRDGPSLGGAVDDSRPGVAGDPEEPDGTLTQRCIPLKLQALLVARPVLWEGGKYGDPQ
ncbi:MAG: hypothetical protein ACLQDQ_03435 [Myxococcaceae bacterium]